MKIVIFFEKLDHANMLSYKIKKFNTNKMSFFDSTKENYKFSKLENDNIFFHNLILVVLYDLSEICDWLWEYRPKSGEQVFSVSQGKALRVDFFQKIF